MERVEQGGASEGAGVHKTAIQPVRVAGEGDGEFGSFVELDQEELVGGICGLQDARCRFRGSSHLVLHAGAGIQEHADGNGRIFLCEIGDVPLGILVEQVETLLGEIGNRGAVGGHDVDRD